MKLVVLKKPNKIKFRSIAEILASEEKAKNDKNRLNEAYAIIERMNREGKLISEIMEALIGYQNRNYRPFNEQNIKAYLKSKGQKFKTEKRIDTQSKYEPIPLEKGVNQIDYRIGKSRPNILSIALGVLAGRFKWDSNGYSLRRDGKWHIASLCEVMRETNKEQKKQGLPQITLNPNWVVQ